ncbi:hypothetical protein [Nocardia pseudobrasiliensis]|uniref:hypothetical protein n=1 Tax=Nocardia pseudobrasiliensis TaxID=45979 RepID=UPI000831B21F|nr:hypothetical protein [Nocardia pseudobrasiliensis]
MGIQQPAANRSLLHTTSNISEDDFETDTGSTTKPQAAIRKIGTAPASVDFIEALLRRWPDIGEEGSPWTSSMRADLNGPALRLNIDWDRAAEVAPGVAELARQHGLQCYGGSTTVPWILR